MTTGSSRCHHGSLPASSRRQSRPVSSSWTSSPPPSRTRRSSPNRSTSTRRRSMFRLAVDLVDGDRPGLGDHVSARPARRATPRARCRPPRRRRARRRRGAGRGRRGGSPSGRSETIARPSSAHHGPADASQLEPGVDPDLAPLGARRAAATAARRTRPEWPRARGVPTSNWPGCIAWRASREVANAASVSARRSAGWSRRTAHGRDRSRSCRRSPSSRRRGGGQRGRRARLGSISARRSAAAMASAASGGALRAA